MRPMKPISVMSFLLLAACGAWCQCDGPDLLPAAPNNALNSHDVQRLEIRTWKSLPDAPSALPPTQGDKFRVFVEEAGSPLTFGAAGVNTGIMHLTDVGGLSREVSLTELYKGALIQKESSAFFSKYLYPALLKQDPRYHRSSSPSFWRRLTYAASRTVITRNDSGTSTLNTSYFLGVLTSVAITTAYRPYWTRSTSATFNTFASTIGTDVGINILHEFGPGIRHIVKGHAPKFVSRIEQRIADDQTLSESPNTPK